MSKGDRRLRGRFLFYVTKEVYAKRSFFCQKSIDFSTEAP